MNNIKSFNEYTHQELEVIAYDNVLNEGLRSFFNKRATAKVRSELADEIEMSKTIMDGIKEGLESLNENFDAIRKGIEDTDKKQIRIRFNKCHKYYRNKDLHTTYKSSV